MGVGVWTVTGASAVAAWVVGRVAREGLGAVEMGAEDSKAAELLCLVEVTAGVGMAVGFVVVAVVVVVVVDTCVICWDRCVRILPETDMGRSHVSR